MNNRIHNASNPHQGGAKRVLCVCSAGLLRSPTLAWILSNEPYNYNTRAAGTSWDHALIVVDEVLLNWADEIICMDWRQEDYLNQLLDKVRIDRRVTCLEVPDQYGFKDPKLIEHLTRAYKDHYERDTGYEVADS